MPSTDDEISAPEYILLRDALQDEETARSLASAPGGWRDLGPNELPALGLSKAHQRALRAVQQLCSRCLPELRRHELLDSKEVARVYQRRLPGVMDELMLAVALDSGGYFLQELCIGKNTGHGYGLETVRVLRPLIRAGAETFVVVHHQPGKPILMPDLKFFVERLVRAADAVQMALVDVVVVGGRGAGWISCKAKGLLDLEPDTAMPT